MSVISFDHPTLAMLRRLSPPKVLCHITEAPWGLHEYAGFGPEKVVLIGNADVDAADRPNLTNGGPSLMTRFSAVLSDESREQTFYTASLGRECGLINPAHLTSIWRNLSEIRREQVETITLDELLAQKIEAFSNLAEPNWLIIDSMPVAPKLEGATETLKTLDVVVARCLADEVFKEELEMATASEVLSTLRDSDFTYHEDLSGSHPKLRYLLCTRSIIGERSRANAHEATIARHNELEDQITRRLEHLDELERSAKRLVLTENNLKNLQQRYAALAEENDHLNGQLSLIRQQLDHALELLHGSDSSAETETGVTK
ncbi:MAG: hypothetical protein AAF950_01345 [Pseudomonadota bacterium]